MRSQPDVSVLDALIELVVEPHEALGRGIAEIDRIANRHGVEALAHQVDLLLLEGRGHLELALPPQEYRPRIVGQVLAELRGERGEIARAFAGDRCHSGATVAARD